MSDLPVRNGDNVRQAAGIFKNIPVVAQIVIFLLLAVVAGLAGTLDDWVRLVLAVLFVGVAASLFAEARQGFLEHHAGGVEVKPPAPPAPSDPYDVGPQAPED